MTNLPDIFYPIASNEEEIALAVNAKVRFLQLRFKGSAGQRRAQIEKSLRCCKKAGAVCVINDYWQEALTAGAEWIHLGQEDLDTLTQEGLAEIRRKQIKLGISTHDEAELSRALGFHPAYIALGPIWETTLKKMKWAPQGLEKLKLWRERLPSSLPLVAIGGLTPERGKRCLEAGAQAVSCVSGVFKQKNPAQAIEEWQTRLRQ